MVNNKNFVVTERLMRYWTTRFGDVPSCQVCGDKFKVGDKVESKGGGPMKEVRRFHEDCLGSTPLT